MPSGGARGGKAGHESPAQIDFRERVALVILSLPVERRVAAVENAFDGYRLSLDLAFPDHSDALKWELAATFENALRTTLKELSCALSENGEMARA